MLGFMEMKTQMVGGMVVEFLYLKSKYV
jgi:hypothetical protein